jgi:WhiB family transcriptional regulator, redox-sensing transcriptional regulator
VLYLAQAEASKVKTSTVTTMPIGDRPMDWLGHAACRDSDPELFFPASDMSASAGRARVEAAKKVCRRCPVRGTCLSWAFDNGQEAGVWGGMTEEERRRLRRRPVPG